MPSHRQILSSANLLLIFEAAGRHLNFSAAATELGVSQPAVSHAMKKLERELGVPLFEREHRGVRLSKAGDAFYLRVSTALNDIYRAADELKHQHNLDHVTLSVSTAFAAHWLMPRIARFQQQYPEIELRCLTTDSDTQHQHDESDLRLPLGVGQWPNHQQWHFMDEVVVAICSPGYLTGQKPIKRVDDLLDHYLLELEVNYPQRLDWTSWLRKAGVDGQPKRKPFLFNDYSVVIKAALEGQGIALGWRHIVDPLLEQGRLVTAVPNTVVTDNPFYILAPGHLPLSPATVSLRDWLIAEVNLSAAYHNKDMS